MNLALKVAILESGLTQRAIAHQIGMDEATLSTVIHQWRDATDAQKKALAKALKRPISVLFPEVAA